MMMPELFHTLTDMTCEIAFRLFDTFAALSGDLDLERDGAERLCGSAAAIEPALPGSAFERRIELIPVAGFLQAAAGDLGFLPGRKQLGVVLAGDLDGPLQGEGLRVGSAQWQATAQ